MKYRDKRIHFKFHVNLIVKANRRGKNLRFAYDEKH